MILSHELGDNCSGAENEANRLRTEAGDGGGAFEVVHVHEEGQCLPSF